MIVKLVPYPDEHIYSYVQRLAEANAIPLRMFVEYYFGRDRKKKITNVFEYKDVVYTIDSNPKHKFDIYVQKRTYISIW